MNRFTVPSCIHIEHLTLRFDSNIENIDSCVAPHSRTELLKTGRKIYPEGVQFRDFLYLENCCCEKSPQDILNF